MKKTVGNFSLLAAITVFTASSNATILTGNVTAGSGSFSKLLPEFTESIPDNTVGNDNFQNTHLYAFDEGQNITLTRAITVDDLGGAGAGVLTAGTVVASHYVFFDPSVAARQQGSITFDSDILAVISSTANLAGSDFLINTGINYLNPEFRGLESDDSVSIIDPRTLEVNWIASTPGDYVRVLTAFSPGATPTTLSLAASIPEPASLALLGLGLALCGYQSKRKELKK